MESNTIAAVEIRRNISYGVQQAVQFSLDSVNKCSHEMKLQQGEAMFYKTLHEILVPVIFSIIAVIGCVGNSLVIFVIVRRHQMRTSLNVLLLNLAVGDLCFLIFCVPLTAYHYASPEWTLGSALCHIWNYPFFVAFYVNMFTLVSISVWRYMTVVRFAETTEYRTVKMAGTLSIALWIMMNIGNIPSLFVLEIKHEITLCQDYAYCGMANLKHTRILFLCFFGIGYLIPMVALILFNLALLSFVKHNEFARPENQQYTNRESHKKTQKITRTIIIVIGSFCTSWLPLHIHLLYVYFGDLDVVNSYAYSIFRVLAHIMAYANSCVNPIIYHCTSTDFKQHFLSLKPKCKSREQFDNHMELTANRINAVQHQNLLCNGVDNVNMSTGV